MSDMYKSIGSHHFVPINLLLLDHSTSGFQRIPSGDESRKTTKVQHDVVVGLSHFHGFLMSTKNTSPGVKNPGKSNFAQMLKITGDSYACVIMSQLSGKANDV